MNKKDYVWIFNEAALGAGINGVFSLEYHIPGAKLKVDPTLLVGSRVWLVIKSGADNFLYAMIAPSAIELYKEGKYKDDYLLYAASFFSVRFLPRHEAREPWRLSPFQAEEEIRECTDSEQLIFRKLVDQNHRVSFAPPSRLILDSVPRTVFADLEHSVQDQFLLALRTVAFGDVMRTHSFPDSISALGGVTLTILKSVCPQLAIADVINLIAALDPITKMADSMQKSQQDVLKTLSSLPPIVDTFLEEIDPEKISLRVFVAGMPNFSSEWLEKTNDAEQEHEKILKDIVLRLRSRGFKIYKSRSFDVLSEKAGMRTLWEIKSANGSNSVAQGEKGIIQLLRYSTVLSDNGWGDTSFLLLLQDSGQSAVQQYLSKMAGRVGVSLRLYDERKAWPHRVFGLKTEVFPDL